jgi:hypothetical protein
LNVAQVSQPGASAPAWKKTDSLGCDAAVETLVCAKSDPPAGLSDSVIV